VFTVITVQQEMAAAAAPFVPDFRLNPENGQPLASPENKAMWTLEHFKELQARQAMWADIMALQKSKPATAASAAPVAGSMAERAAKQITAIYEALKALCGSPFGTRGARSRSKLAQALLLSSRSKEVNRELTDDDLIKFLSNPCDIRSGTSSSRRILLVI